MRGMREQLRAIGLVSEQSFRTAEAQEQLDEQARVRRPEQRTYDLNDLSADMTSGKLMEVAHRILQTQPQLIYSLIQEMHLCTKGRSEQAKMAWRLYQIRDNIGDVPRYRLSEYLKRAFRRVNPVFVLD